ncbi:MAG: hypothetical protein CSB47_02295 [Proteobacteria bacterium]|nr:MAG: hypothetical protein CSB47_02295 [Pseudomonadota bacterium]
MNKKTLLIFIAGYVLLFGLPAWASEKLKGGFIVTQQCKAYSSIRKKTNPVDLVVGRKYRVVAKNKPSPSHYRIIVAESRSQNNWVAVGCGRLVGATQPTPETPHASGKTYLLALSWQPGFCLTHASKRECQRASSTSYSARHLSLHGLWPQPRNNTYCGVSETDRSIDRRSHWGLLKPLTLSATTRRALSKAMPGHLSFLQRHEWVKHGTCYSQTAEQYYVDSIHLTQQVNATAVDEWLTQNKGQSVTLSSIRKALASSVGEQAASKVALRCGRKNQITELWIGLRGNIKTTPLRQLMEQGDTPQSNCQAGVVSRY